MPRRSKLKRRSSGWSEQHIEILKTGNDWFELFRDLIDQHAAWQDLRKEILAEWLAEHPGTRPYAWWAFDMPKGSRRECVNGRHPFDDPVNGLQRKLWYGKPQFQRPCDLLALYESEASFLRRNQLLVPQEVKFFER